MKYCPQCGHKLSIKNCCDDGDVPYCIQCEKLYFNSPSACIIAMVINEDREIALLKQGYVSESYVFVAGYIISGESAETSAFREVEEELGITPISVKYINSYVYDKNDMLMLGYIVNVKKQAFKLSREVDSAIWVNIDQADQFLRDGKVTNKMLEEYRNYQL